MISVLNPAANPPLALNPGVVSTTVIKRGTVIKYRRGLIREHEGEDRACGADSDEIDLLVRDPIFWAKEVRARMECEIGEI